ncbi:MAG TPA: tripartite tricarboxylate transporter TctB family protein [Methylomirabilota bacterium]|nr:tripartite tricarboxylate transporter TctB family protein [Methylomirabilota bacterium]
MEHAGGRRPTDPEAYASAFLFALAAAVALGAHRLGLGTVHDPGPGFMPFATATLLAAMALGRLVRVAIAPPGQAGGGPAPTASRWGVVSVVLATLFGAGFILERAGFSITIFLMLVVLFGIVADKRWWVTLLSAAVVVTAARLLCRALGVPVPEGPLGI